MTRCFEMNSGEASSIRVLLLLESVVDEGLSVVAAFVGPVHGPVPQKPREEAPGINRKFQG